MSRRANAPLVELNCANLPEHLVEAELFGYRKGAFTGADHDRKGLFEEADGGILFLDEIGDIAPTVQNRLLKAIEDKTIKRLGTNNYQFCDVQIIAATSQNLPQMIQAGRFREDLYCRLAVLTVETCPLRARREDIPAMISCFLREAAHASAPSSNEAQTYRIEDDALTLLSALEYPGNIRSLRNLIYELTSYVDDFQPISIELVQLVLAKTISRGIKLVASANAYPPEGQSISAHRSAPTHEVGSLNPTDHESLLLSIVRDGDIVLPLDLCVLRRGETFKQWTARARRSSIEAARKATGGTMQSAAKRLGLTRSSLKSHLQRARRSEGLFDSEQQSDRDA
jgi:DNA-binding NtrC family response regulator